MVSEAYLTFRTAVITSHKKKETIILPRTKQLLPDIRKRKIKPDHSSLLKAAFSSWLVMGGGDNQDQISLL